MAARLRRQHHFFERGAPVARNRGVHVEIADDVAYRAWQPAALGRLDLPGVLAQDRRNERKPKGLVDLLFGLAGDHLAPFDLREGIFIQREPARKRALAELDVVSLGAREVEAGGSPARPPPPPPRDPRAPGGGPPGPWGAPPPPPPPPGP